MVIFIILLSICITSTLFNILYFKYENDTKIESIELFMCVLPLVSTTVSFAIIFEIIGTKLLNWINKDKR